MKLVAWLVTNAIALAAAAWLFDGIRLHGADWQHKIVPLLLATLLTGIVSAFVRPVVRLLSLPFILLTIGLFLLVINALMLLLSSWLAGQLGIGFSVDGFWTAFWAAIVMTVVNWAVGAVLPDGDSDHGRNRHATRAR